MSALGLNTLDTRDLPLNAEYTKTDILVPAIPGLTGAMGAPAIIARATTDRLSEPISVEEVKTKVKQPDIKALNDRAVAYAREEIKILDQEGAGD